MKKKLPGILFGILFLIGFAILSYPAVADQWNTYRQNREGDGAGRFHCPVGDGKTVQ